MKNFRLKTKRPLFPLGRRPKKVTKPADVDSLAKRPAGDCLQLYDHCSLFLQGGSAASLNALVVLVATLTTNFYAQTS